MNFDLTSSLLELVATYSSIMILLSQVDDRRLVSERERGGGRGGGRGEGGGGRGEGEKGEGERGREGGRGERGGGWEGEGREGEGGREGERERERRIAEHISARQPNPGCILAIMRTYYMLVMLRNVQLCTRKNRAPCMCMRQPWPAQGKTCASAF